MTPGTWRDMRPHRIPERLGGNGDRELFEISIASLASPLAFRQDGARHGVVEPAVAIDVSDFQEALCNTRTSWSKVAK
ncbi:MAG: hypothetical protein KC731_24435 [Myxococcales bacterium]|nr:hypothetical protein [Myxococcales bacterium]